MYRMAVAVPTYVGVNRPALATEPQLARCPHLCGGEPTRSRSGRAGSGCPHLCGGEPPAKWMRLCACRCPHLCGGEPKSRHVHDFSDDAVPTYVGVNRGARRKWPSELGLSPPMWG